MYWYVGVVVTFTTLTGGTETVLTERLDKTTLNFFFSLNTKQYYNTGVCITGLFFRKC